MADIVSQGGVVAQWAKDVTEFSSQYGNETSISYSVSNIIGQSTIYPSYGDFNQAAVLRTYGPWWKNAPSASKTFGRIPPSFQSQDFIELLFEHEVFPTKIEIYETYHPGAVVRILACDTKAVKMQQFVRQDKSFSDCLRYPGVPWFVLWEGGPEKAPATARIFMPDISPVCPFPTNIIRIEFNSCFCDYYTELDAVRLYGIEPSDSSKQKKDQLIKEGTDLDKAYEDNVKQKEELQSGGNEKPQESYAEKIAKDLTNLHLQDIDGLSAALEVSNNGYFDLLPGEVLQEIIGYLDLPSLCRLAQVSHLFNRHCYDNLQFTELNLKPYWHQITEDSLWDFVSRCRHLQKIDLSWCGHMYTISHQGFIRFIQVCGQELACLRLSNCGFINNDCVKAICQSAPNITELDLQSCRHVDNFGYAHISRLSKLKKLNLYRSMIDIHSLIAIIRSCHDLEDLNLGSCSSIIDYNDVAIELSQHCKHLRCLDLWRARSLSDNGLNALSHHCIRIEELDLGWCSSLVSNTGCFVELFKRCNKLRKIFLTANRTVCDRDLDAIATYCPHMEQIDILGTREVSKEVALRVLEKCQKLRFIDVSFCAGIEFATVREWEAAYPHVAVKKSFQNN